MTHGLRLFPEDVVKPPTGVGETVIVKKFFGSENVEMVVSEIRDGFFYVVSVGFDLYREPPNARP